MRHSERFGLNSNAPHASWRHSASFLICISIAGTLLAVIMLIFDGWLDALLLFIVCTLILMILLSHLAALQSRSSVAPIFESAVPNSEKREIELLTQKLFRRWPKNVISPPGAEPADSPPVLIKLTPAD